MAPDQTEAIRVIRGAHALGVAFFDKAKAYGPVTNETLHPEAREANHALVELLQRVADAKGGTPAQIAIAGLLAQKPWIVPIPVKRRLERVEDNPDAAAIALTVDDLAEIEEAAAWIEVQGARLPEAILQFWYRRGCRAGRTRLRRLPRMSFGAD